MGARLRRWVCDRLASRQDSIRTKEVHENVQTPERLDQKRGKIPTTTKNTATVALRTVALVSSSMTMDGMEGRNEEAAKGESTAE